MRRAAAALTLLLATLPAAAALVAGAERPVSDVEVRRAGGSNIPLAVATDGARYLSLWMDRTRGREGVFAALSTDLGGSLPMPSPRIVDGYAWASTVWTGNSYLVALQRQNAPALLTQLDRDANVIAPSRPIGIDLSITSLTWNGYRALAVGSDANGPRAVLLDAQGNVLGDAIALPAGFRFYEFRAVAAGNAFVLVWTEETTAPEGPMPLTRVRAARINNAGDVSAPIELVAPTQTYVSVSAGSGTPSAGIAVTVGGDQKTLRRFTINGATLAVTSDEVQMPGLATSPVAVVFTSGHFVAAWSAYVSGNPKPQLLSARFDRRTVFSLELESTYDGLIMASNGGSIFALWGYGPVRGTVFEADLLRRVAFPMNMPTAATRQDAPVLAPGNREVLAAWIESADIPGEAFVRRFDSAGNALTAAPIRVATLADASYAPAVVFMGEEWLIAWCQLDGGVFVQRVATSGKAIGTRVRVSDSRGPFAIATNGGVAALVISDENRKTIRVVRLAPGGERIDEIPLVTAVRYELLGDAAIASNGTEFLVTWSRTYGGVSVMGQRLDATGAPLDVAPFPIATSNDWNEAGARVASNGTDFVVAYVQYTPYARVDPPLENPPPFIQTVMAKRVLRNGVLADTIAAQEGTILGAGAVPRITSSAGGYTVTFLDHDEIPELGRNYQLLSAISLDAQAQIIAPAHTVLRMESYSSHHDVANVSGSVWTSYARVAEELLGVQRVYLRGIEEGPARRRSARR